MEQVYEDIYSDLPKVESCPECDTPMREYFDSIAKEKIYICGGCGLTESNKS